MTIQYNVHVLFIYFLFIIFWIISVWLIKVLSFGLFPAGSRLTWKSIFLSFYGVVWFGFGVQYIMRFLLLVYDPITYRVTSFPPWQFPPEVFTQTFVVLIVYWGSFCFGCILLNCFLASEAPAIIKDIEGLASVNNIYILDIIALITTILIIITSLNLCSNGLLTPLGNLATLNIIPLTSAWLLYFRGQKIGGRRFIYMLPGIINYILNPYRGILFGIVICIIITAIKYKRNISIIRVCLGIIIFLTITTYYNDLYRTYKWGSPDKYAGENIDQKWKDWERDPSYAPWTKVLNRLHGFDSAALTVYCVPGIFPYSDKNFLFDTIIKSFIPRIIFSTKDKKERAREFSTTIWALDPRERIEKRTSAMIAPSMPGDLYTYNGLTTVFLGGSLMGIMIGFLESWGRSSGPSTYCFFLTLFWVFLVGVTAADFTHGFAAITQQIIALIFAIKILKNTALRDVFNKKSVYKSIQRV